LKYELFILNRALELTKKDGRAFIHLMKMMDSGATDEFKFLVFRALGDNLYDITRTRLKSSFSMSTSLRVAMQMLSAVSDLHTIGFLHRSLRPQVFAIGLGQKIRTIYMSDLGSPFMYRDLKTNKIRRPRTNVRTVGTLRYMSRNSQMNKEHSRRDDLEAWVYLSMEFFDLNVLPWCDDQDSSSVLHKKQELVDGYYSAPFVTMTFKFKEILHYVANLKFNERPNYMHIRSLLNEIQVEKKVNFGLPYDWENLEHLRDVSDVPPTSSTRSSTPEASPKIESNPTKRARSFERVLSESDDNIRSEERSNPR